jgi:hypothetical protein
MAVNPTDVTLNAVDIINSLNFASNCTTAMNWFDAHNPAQYWYNGSQITEPNGTEIWLPNGFSYPPYDNDTLNHDFLQMSLPFQYQNSSDVLDILQNKMASQWNGANVKGVSTWNISITWYEHALWQIYFNCVGPETFSIHLRDLDRTSDCNTSATFIMALDSNIVDSGDPTSITYISPLYSNIELAFWRGFLQPLNPNIDLVAAFMLDGNS